MSKLEQDSLLNKKGRGAGALSGKSHLLFRVGAIILSGCLAGCSEGDTLEGSLSEVLDLGFTDVKGVVSDAEVSIRYVKYRENGEQKSEDVVLKLSATGSGIASGVELDLSPAADGSVRATLTRSVAEDPIHDLAAIRRGTLKIDSLSDGEIVGSFRVTLGEGGDAGRGRTAFGEFHATRDQTQ